MRAFVAILMAPGLSGEGLFARQQGELGGANGKTICPGESREISGTGRLDELVPKRKRAKVAERAAARRQTPSPAPSPCPPN
jgi:hypothetical protein